jgi:hypothetical protein
LSIKAAQVADAPTDLQNVPGVTSANQIGLQWTAPAFDGGQSIIDYQLWYDNASGTTYEILESSLTGLTYTAIDLT